MGVSLQVAVLGFRRGSVIIDYSVEIEATTETRVLEKRTLEERIKYNLKNSRQNSLGIDPDSIAVEGRFLAVDQLMV